MSLSVPCSSQCEQDTPDSPAPGTTGSLWGKNRITESQNHSLIWVGKGTLKITQTLPGNNSCPKSKLSCPLWLGTIPVALAPARADWRGKGEGAERKEGNFHKGSFRGEMFYTNHLGFNGFVFACKALIHEKPLIHGACWTQSHQMCGCSKGGVKKQP